MNPEDLIDFHHFNVKSLSELIFTTSNQTTGLVSWIHPLQVQQNCNLWQCGLNLFQVRRCIKGSHLRIWDAMKEVDLIGRKSNDDWSSMTSLLYDFHTLVETGEKAKKCDLLCIIYVLLYSYTPQLAQNFR